MIIETLGISCSRNKVKKKKHAKEKTNFISFHVMLGQLASAHKTLFHLASNLAAYIR